jgi:hypothetical protein
MKTTWMKLVIDACAFLELSGDDVVAPDAAVKQLESITATLQDELSEDERREFISYCEDLARRERAAGWSSKERITFVKRLPEYMGLRRHEDETTGKVSLWLGHARSREELVKALHVKFSEDGDFLGSEFSRAFEVGYYDAGVEEAEFRPGRSSLAELLAGASRYDELVRQLEVSVSLDPDTNCFVLLYDYEHAGPTEGRGDGWTMRYVGAASYEP